MLQDWEGPQAAESSEIYHLRGGLSSTDIKWMNKSPFHFKRFVLDGLQLETASLSFGSIAHEAIFEGAIDRFAALPDFSPIETEIPGKREGTTKKHTITIKSQVEDWKAANPDKKVITKAEMQKIKDMKEAFDQCDVVQSLLSEDDVIEQSIIFHDDEHDVACRFRPDRYNLKRGLCLDYKTCTNAQEHSFKWSIVKYGYHISAAHYMKGLDRIWRDQVKHFYWICQETVAPYACAVYKLSMTDLVVGLDIRSHLIRKIQKHKKDNHWPHYGNGEIKEINIPDIVSEEVYESHSFE